MVAVFNLDIRLKTAFLGGLEKFLNDLPHLNG